MKWYRKSTQSRCTMRYDSVNPFRYIRSYITGRLHTILTSNTEETYLQNDLSEFKQILRQNGYPTRMVDTIFEKEIPRISENIRDRYQKIDQKIYIKKPSFLKNKEETIFLVVDFCSKNVENICVNLIRFLKKFINNTRFQIIYKTKKLMNFIKRRNSQTDFEKTSHCIYQFNCCCSAAYVGQSKRYLSARISEHKGNNKSNIYSHYIKCATYKDELIKNIQRK